MGNRFTIILTYLFIGIGNGEILLNESLLIIVKQKKYFSISIRYQIVNKLFGWNQVFSSCFLQFALLHE